MYLTFNDVQRFTLNGSDEELGQVKDIYVDQDTWKISYLVIETGSWFASKRVLIETASLINVDLKNRRLISSLKREDLENAPSIEEHKPAGADQNRFWLPAFDQSVYLAMAGGAGLPSLIYEYQGRPDFYDAIKEMKQTNAEVNHLRSAQDLLGYSLHESDDKFGYISDLVLNSDDWSLSFFAIDTGGWLSERMIIFAASWVTKISWSTESIFVSMTRAQIESGPVLESLEGLERSYEEELFTHYNYPYY